MAEPKTKPTDQDVEAFIDGLADEKRRQDCRTIVRLMQAATKAEPQMWGANIVGFGRYRYKYASGREGEWFLTGFSPRKQNLTLYIMAGFEQYDALLEKLGKFKTGKSCLYIKTVDDVHVPTLRQLIKQSVQHMARTNP